MKKITIVLAIFFSLTPGLLKAQQEQTTYAQIISAGIALAKQNIDNVEKDKDYQNGQIGNANFIINNANNAIANDNASELVSQQGLYTMATQMSPIPDAVAVCAENPALYCPGYVVPTPPTPPVPPVPSPTGVNWDALAAEMLTGVNWPTALNNLGLNWSTVNQASGINWSSLNILPTGINWNDWTNQEAQGVNWSQWLYNGGQ